MPRRLATLTLVLAIVSLSAASQSRPDEVVFARVFPQPHQVGLFIANADGSGERPIVSPGDTDYDATWSPDGLSIVFTSERDGSADLYRVLADGSHLERLTDSPSYDDQASFSPDGKSLVFVTTRAGGTADLWMLDLATRRAHALTSGPGGDFRPSWSPDGRWIAFSSDRQSNLPFSRGRWEHLQLADIYVIRADGSGLRQLTRQHDFCGSPKWYPDSATILAYCVAGQETLDVRRVETEHSVPTRIVKISLADGAITDLTNAAGVKFNPSLVGGTRLAWLRKDGPDRGVQYADGTAGPRGDLRSAAWSPDGTRVAYHKRVPFERKPWVQTYSKSPKYVLTLTNGGPSFNPDGNKFVFVGPGANAKAAGVAVGTPGSDTYDVIYKDPSRNILGPQWSADGKQIIFGIGEFAAFFNGFHSEFMKPEDRAEGGAQVAIVNNDGTGFREITKGPNNNGFPSFAPDGERFVYRTFGPEGDGLRISNLRTGESRMLSKGYDNFPLWSPRGDLIMFSGQVDGDYEIYTIKPDGTGLKRLTNSRGNDAHMAWSPDGSHIVFTSTRMGFKDEAVYTDAPQPYGEIFVMRADGTDVQQLTDNQWEEGTPAWRPR
jgi:Tol biopolymer transport system component